MPNLKINTIKIKIFAANFSSRKNTLTDIFVHETKSNVTHINVIQNKFVLDDLFFMILKNTFAL